MIYLLCEHFSDSLENIGFYAWKEVSFRAVVAILTSLLVCLVWGPRIIRWLIRKKVGDIPEFNHDTLNELARHKSNTPTMGGIIILLGIFVSTLLWADLTNPFVKKGLFLMVWLGVLGGVDDWLKLTKNIKHRSRDGLFTWEKLIFQIALGALLAHFLFNTDFALIKDGRHFFLPFYKHGFELGYWAFMLITILVITGTSNAVNLTDGMDGLATGCMSVISALFVMLCYFASEHVPFHKLLSDLTWASYLLLPQISGAGELAVFYAAVFGACLGFLWFNCHPAQVFMGDIGSLTLGGAIGYGAIVTRHELLLFVAGGVFVLEAISVIVQVAYFKMSGGKRVFRCAPIHHHYHLLGWSEPQVVVRFWLLAIACAAFALATLKIR